MNKIQPRERLKQLLIQGDMTYGAIAERLNFEGHKTPRGNKWKEANIASWAHMHRSELKSACTIKKSKAVKEPKIDTKYLVAKIKSVTRTLEMLTQRYS